MISLNQISRRSVLALMPGAWFWLPGALAVADGELPVRMGISDSQMVEVNLNDARAAMQIWVNRMNNDLKIPIDRSGNLIYTSQEIIEKVRRGELDAVALNILEYRQVADLLDSSQIISPAGVAGLEQYLVLVKRNGPVQSLADLRGRQLRMLTVPKMCVAPAWLFMLLEERHLGAPEQFFGALTTDAKASQVVLPVFFGKADACLTLKRSFDTICELNPQVAKELSVLAISPAMIVGFFIFQKNYRSLNREKVINALSGLRASPAGQQLNTLFQFDVLEVRGAGCLSAALGILDAADSIRRRIRATERSGK
jgi:phosphonate transport system substrate-binding protein